MNTAPCPTAPGSLTLSSVASMNTACCTEVGALNVAPVRSASTNELPSNVAPVTVIPDRSGGTPTNCELVNVHEGNVTPLASARVAVSTTMVDLSNETVDHSAGGSVSIASTVPSNVGPEHDGDDHVAPSKDASSTTASWNDAQVNDA